MDFRMKTKQKVQIEKKKIRLLINLYQINYRKRKCVKMYLSPRLTHFLF